MDDGWAELRCADACVTLAIRLVDDEEARAQGLLDGAEVWKPERAEELGPRLYYRHLPKGFIAGKPYDPVGEVVFGATATPGAGDGGGEALTTETDARGNFWFEGLEDGVYDLELKCGGQVVRFAGHDAAVADINLGDVPLV